MAYRRRWRRPFAPPPELHKINRRIRAPEVRLIGADGEQIGVVPIDDALRRAGDAHLDLVEVAPTAKPPVCRILDYGKFKYQQQKKEAEAKKKASTTNVKMLRFGYRTDTGDIQRQLSKARAFIENGDRVKLLLRFRGREMAYQNLGREKLMGVCAALEDVAAVEGSPRMEGRMMGVVLAPTRKRGGKSASAKGPKKATPKKAAPAAPAPAGASAPAAELAPAVEAAPEADSKPLEETGSRSEAAS